jgi:hypothetical protein
MGIHKMLTRVAKSGFEVLSSAPLQFMELHSPLTTKGFLMDDVFKYCCV